MIHELLFTKVSGAGNDFVIIDNREATLPADKASLALCLCSRNFGVGADGLLLLERSSYAHFSMKYYNADGSYGGMCGNGGRCIARYAFVNGIAPKDMVFDALDFGYHATILADRVILHMKEPSEIKAGLQFQFDAVVYDAFFLDTGSPHIVMFVDNVEEVDVDQLGRAIRNDPACQPEGTNVNFVEIKGTDSIKLRTYERGVESETMACGTGSVAAGVIAHLMKKLELPITVHVRSGETLKVNGVSDGEMVTAPTLEGSAHILFAGRAFYDDSKHILTDIAA